MARGFSQRLQCSSQCQVHFLVNMSHSVPRESADIQISLLFRHGLNWAPTPCTPQCSLNTYTQSLGRPSGDTSYEVNDFLTFMATCNGAKGFKDGEDSPPLVFHVS